MPHAGAMKRNRRRGVSLLETAFGLAILGSLLAIFVPTFVRSLHTSKTGEAVDRLAEMHARTATYFGTSFVDGTTTRRWCLPDEAGPTPRAPTANPVEYDFSAENAPGRETWVAIGFDPERTRFRYSLVPESTGCGIRRPARVSVVTFVAEGDLDLDGHLSRFERAASVDPEGHLVPEGALHVDDPVE